MTRFLTRLGRNQVGWVSDPTRSGQSPNLQTCAHRARMLRPKTLRMLLFAPCIAVGALADERPASVVEVVAGEDYRAKLAGLRPGDELRFLPGVHEAHAVVQVSGTPDRPITIRGVVDSGERPELRFTGRGHNLWRIAGSHLRIKDLSFHATHAYGIRVERVDDLTIENCTFRQCGGGDISANSAHVHGLRIAGCRFVGSRRTPVYIGNHPGQLDIANFVFEGNVIDGRHIDGGIGYGIQLKLNVRGGVIRDNVITGTRGPGIMVYGVQDGAAEDASVIERNVVIGSRNNPGIAIGGGPAVVRNNLVIGCQTGGIGVFDYGGRGLLQSIRIEENGAAMNMGHDLSIRGQLVESTLKANRIWTRQSDPRLPGWDQAGLDVAANRIQRGGQAWQQILGRLKGVVPSDAARNAVSQRLSQAMPQSEEELIALLQALLD